MSAVRDERCWRVRVLSVVPSPYQRDLFAAMDAHPRLDLDVLYLEGESPDSPWPGVPLRGFESILPGSWVGVGNIRWHRNPPPADGRGDVDCLVVNGFMSNAAQRLMRTASAVPWLFWGERLREQRGVKRIIQRILTAPFRRAAGIVGIGTMACDDYARRFPGVPVYNIPYHCDMAGFQDAARRRRGEGTRASPRVLFCGQMIGRKGVDLLLEAFSRVVEGGVDAELALVGREAELPAMLGRVPAGIRSRIDYRGFKAPEELPGEFFRADLFVLPSRHDGWGVVVNQALAAGLPILCSDAVGAAGDLVEEGRNGRLFPADEPALLENALMTMLSDRAELERMGERSAWMAADWTPESGAAKWIDVFEEVAGR